MGNRKKFTSYVVEQFKAMGNHADSATLAKEWLESLTDAEFEELVTKIESGETFLTYVIPNEFTKEAAASVNLEKHVKFGESIGSPIYSKVVEEDASTGLIHTSNEEHWIALMPERSQIQHVDDKKSIAKDSKVRDLFTGQVTGDSKGSAVSAPQFASILQRNCFNTALEFAKFRGGDIDAGREFNTALIEGGQVYIEPLLDVPSRPTVNFSISAYLNGMMLSNNLLKPKERM